MEPSGRNRWQSFWLRELGNDVIGQIVVAVHGGLSLGHGWIDAASLLVSLQTWFGLRPPSAAVQRRSRFCLLEDQDEVFVHFGCPSCAAPVLEAVSLAVVSFADACGLFTVPVLEESHLYRHAWF